MKKHKDNSLWLRVIKSVTIIFPIASFILLIGMLKSHQVLAQSDGNITWQEALNLSNSLPSSTYPTIVSDQYGFVHVFWGENLGGRSIDPLNQEEASNSITYSYWNGSNWSIPTDLFYSAAGNYNFPYANIDLSGTLHLVWQSNFGIYYSTVPVELASNVKNWKGPQIVARVQGDGPRIYTDKENNLHLIYTSWMDLQNGIKDGNVYYQKSEDGGETWSRPFQLSNVVKANNTIAGHPSIFIDEYGALHTTWYQVSPPDYRGDTIQYARSVDFGETWINPVEIFKKLGNINSSFPEIAGKPPSELHLTWVCGEMAQRCHRRSMDSGQTWTAIEHVFGDMVSLAGWDTLILDGDNILYWILQLRYPEAIYYSFWTGKEWSDLRVVEDGELNGGHYLRAAVHNGNQLDLVMVHQNKKEIWYKLGMTTASSIAPLPTPVSLPTRELEATKTPVASSTPTIAGAKSSELHEDLKSDVEIQSKNTYLLISIVPVAVFIFVVFIVKKWMIH